MNNVSKKLRQSYYDLLSGNISVEVFKEDSPEGLHDHHVVVRVESETDDSNRSGFTSSHTVITEIVGIFKTSVDPDVVDDIDGEIRAILLPENGALEITSDSFGINLIRCLDSHYVSEDDGAKRYYRKITRWQQRVQTS